MLIKGKELLSEYPVALDNFEGPLDLLIQLIEAQKLDVTEVALAAVTDQYLAYLQRMQQLDLEVASEFIVIASRLLDIKTRTLLPPQQPEDSGEEELEDPAAQLLARLEEFRRYKEVAAFLESREAREAPRFPRTPAELAQLEADVDIDGITLADLAAVFNEVLQQVGQRDADDAVQEIVPAPVSVADRQREVLWRLRKSSGQIVFLDLFSGQTSRLEIVVTFLAVLELLRRRRIRVYQSQPLGPILLSPLPAAADQAGSAPAPGDD